MGFRQRDLQDAYDGIRSSLIEISSPYNDGYIQRDCKHNLYLLKCWLEDEYKKLPAFTGEETWEQERIIEVLKKK